MLHSSRNAHPLVPWLSAVAALTWAASTQAAEYYVAPTGSDSNPGSLDQPFASVQHGNDVAKAGDTIWIRGGTYQIVKPTSAGAGISLSKSGTSDASRIKYWAYEGEVPVFDFAMMTLSTTGYTHGFVVSGSWLHIRGLELENVPMITSSNNGMSASGSNNIFELINFHHNSGTGLFINGGNGGNLILNCDSHDNYDPTSSQGDGQNADGFGVHYQMSGPSTVIRGCRAWWNSDDGYDFINHEVPVTVEGSWAMGNGYIKSGAARPAAGNGNGFKAGSSKTGVRHVIQNCLAWGNVASGFYANHSSGGNDWFNDTSYKNGTQYNMLASDPNDSSVTIILMGDKVHKMRNDIGYPNKNTNMTGVDTASNTWDLGITPADADFVSVSDMGFMVAPRQADGSLPILDFMRLSAQSHMLDQGVDVGLPYAGAAPDLGCYETGLPDMGTGGAAGTGNGGAGSGGGSGRGTGGAAAGMGAGDSGAGGALGGGAGSSGGVLVAGAGPLSGAGGTLNGSAGAGGTGAAAGTNTGTGGVAGSGGSSTGTAGGSVSSSGGTAAGSSPAEPNGCGCRTAQRQSGTLGVTLAALALAAFGARRRR